MILYVEDSDEESTVVRAEKRIGRGKIFQSSSSKSNKPGEFSAAKPCKVCIHLEIQRSLMHAVPVYSLAGPTFLESLLHSSPW